MKPKLDALERALRRLVVDPLRPDANAPVEALDVWPVVRDELRAHITVDLAGRRVFGARRVLVRVKTADEERRVQIRAALAEITPESRKLLASEQCRYPKELEVDVEFVDDGPAVAVEFQGGAAAGPRESRRPVFARLEVVRGEAERDSLDLGSEIANIGRRPRVEAKGGAVRRNHLAFKEVTNGVNETVSRWHAHIAYDVDLDAHRLFRDAEGVHVAVVSRAAGDVPPSTGVVLRNGDEIEIGKALVRYVRTAQA